MTSMQGGWNNNELTEPKPTWFDCQLGRVIVEDWIHNTWGWELGKSMGYCKKDVTPVH